MIIQHKNTCAGYWRDARWWPMKAISRRQFLQTAGVAMLVATLPALGRGGRNRRHQKNIRVRSLVPLG
ncbi:MAG: twin-arginine translocation signal domain-containing protein, partial [Kiritimatiellae bacterium]|nr:twin-arginine translocation signal domain-containing protein [Kiritimatiellia bacterium]MBP9571770.1 twin-arginine translocation signal domain-containing protein [Kiritimatiellia bacterium]